MKLKHVAWTEELCGDLCARIIGISDEQKALYRLRFTSVPEDVEACLQALPSENKAAQ